MNRGETYLGSWAVARGAVPYTCLAVMGIHTGLTPPWANIVESVNEIIRIRICSTATSTVTSDWIKWINWLMKG